MSTRTKLVLAAIVLANLTACAVIPAAPAYYGHGGAVVVRPAPYYAPLPPLPPPPVRFGGYGHGYGFGHRHWR